MLPGPLSWSTGRLKDLLGWEKAVVLIKFPKTSTSGFKLHFAYLFWRRGGIT